jgi:uncharacterized protein (DUF849 family)
MRPIIISVAITGSVPRKKDNPALPVLPAEQIESTHAAYEAGATLVHIHVRNDDESPSSDPDRFAEVQAGVRKHCPGMIVQFSTGAGGAIPPRGAYRSSIARTWSRSRPGRRTFPRLCTGIPRRWCSILQLK